eukprot:GHUV01018517.1.p1 GENE.GHUV01018517.1~~GHUV01018517.1.p1  ORF type:complete len:223 (+),score=45.94 GHUV01018517.1:418-1086(+)
MLQIPGMNAQSLLARRQVGYTPTARKQTAASRVSTRVLRTETTESQTIEISVQVPGARGGKTVTSTLEEDWVWTKSQTKITVFSGAQYVETFLAPPLKKAGFTNMDFVEARLDRHTASLANGSPVVCLFVNDDCDAKAVKKLAKAGVKMIAMRCAGYERVDLKACAEHGIKVARVPTYSPTSVAEHAVALLFALNRWGQLSVQHTSGPPQYETCKPELYAQH